MSPRIRKLVGTVLLLVVLAIYSLLVAVAAQLPCCTGGNKIVEMFFYAIAGVAWVLPAGIPDPLDVCDAEAGAMIPRLVRPAASAGAPRGLNRPANFRSANGAPESITFT